MFTRLRVKVVGFARWASQTSLLGNIGKRAKAQPSQLGHNSKPESWQPVLARQKDRQGYCLPVRLP